MRPYIRPHMWELTAGPDGIRWLAPQSEGCTRSALYNAGSANHGLTCLAITSLLPVQSVVGSFAISLVELGQADYALAVAGV